MTKIIKPGAGILFMKVGTHAGEELEDIIKRKRKEIDDAGFALWGYGGNTCHPTTMVRPFAERHEQADSPIYLCMEPMVSNHFAEQLRADEFSADGVNWTTIPAAINVVGSRYALFIETLDAEEFELRLGMTRVAVGPNAGRVGSRYIKGRVDKACLDVAEGLGAEEAEEDKRIVRIGLTAKLRPPYAAFVRTTL